MSPTTSPHPTRLERREAGRALRSKIPRVSHANWDPRARRLDPIDLLRASQRGRVGKLMPIKYGRMAASPFGFYRGAVPIMAADLATLPCTRIDAQLCGDAHVHNLGAYEGPDGRLIFDINDFDETICGPWEWDIKRMAASLVLAGREAGNSDKACRSAVLRFVEAYREAMRDFSEMPVAELARFQVTRYLDISPVMSVLQKAERATPKRNLQKLTQFVDDKHIFREFRPLQFRISGAIRVEVLDSLKNYTSTLLPERGHWFRQYHAADAAFRVVGTGSVGTRDYIVLMLAGAIDDPIFMQIKEETASGYAQYLPNARTPMHQGQRVAEGQRAMQVQSDIFLGWTSIAGREYLVRQLRDHKAGIDDESLKGAGLVQYGLVCGELLSKGHARSGDPCMIYGYLGGSDKFDRAMVKFAVDYADQSTRDWEALTHAVRAGKLPVLLPQIAAPLAPGKGLKKSKKKGVVAAKAKPVAKKNKAARRKDKTLAKTGG